mgnify:CR=1 FL=1
MKSAAGTNAISPVSNALLHLLFIAMSLSCIVPLLLVIAVSVSDEQSIVELGYRFIPPKFSVEA